MYPVVNHNGKTEKKLAKARVKRAKAEARAAEKPRAPAASGTRRVPDGIGIAVNKTPDGSELVVSGLSDNQLRRLLPQLNREVLITVTEDRSSFRAGLMRFVREGVFHTLIKVIAGLIVGYLLIKLGLA